MTRQKFLSAGIAVTALTAAFLIGCGRQAGSPASGGDAEGDALTIAISDGGPNGAMLHGGMFGGIGYLIDLSADQKQQIKVILEKYRPQRRQDFHGQRLSREQWAALRDSMKTIRDSIKNEIASVLTPDQKALLDQVKAQLKAGVVPDTLIKKRVQRLTALLTLTTDQQAQTVTILTQEMQKRLDARGKDSAFVRDSGHSWGMRRHGMAKRRNGSFGLPAEFLNILTDDQKQLLRQKAFWKEVRDSTMCRFREKKQ